MYLFKNVYSHFSRESLSIFTKKNMEKFEDRTEEISRLRFA